MTNDAFTARVEGRVQGVGFRWFIARRAQELGLAGMIANQSDGSVRVVAEGPRPELERLVELLKSGPPAAEVSSVNLEWCLPSNSYIDFDVGYC